jgi:hypothetical protein
MLTTQHIVLDRENGIYEDSMGIFARDKDYWLKSTLFKVLNKAGCQRQFTLNDFKLTQPGKERADICPPSENVSLITSLSKLKPINRS